MAWAMGARPFCCLAVQRLKTRNQFQAVLAGERVAATAHFVLHRCGLDRVGADAAGPAGEDTRPPARLFAAPDVWMGAMVPKRWARRAVTRNTIKRQIYQASSHFEAGLPQAAHLVRLRSAFDRTRFISASSDALKLAVRTELGQLFARGAAVAATRAPAPVSP